MQGLIHAVNTLLPLIEHRMMCARHIYVRWAKKYQSKELQLQFWITARSTNQPELYRKLEKMKKLKGGELAVEELLEKCPIKGWCQAYFTDLVKCDNIDNNMSETFNGVLLEARGKPIISILEEMRQYVMNRIVLKRAFAMKWEYDCGPNIVKRIVKERNNSAKWMVEWNGGACHEIFWDDLVNHIREGYFVRLYNHS